MFWLTSDQTQEQILGCIVLPSYQLLPQRNCMGLEFGDSCPCYRCHFVECRGQQNQKHGQQTLIKEKAVHRHKKGKAQGLKEGMEAILAEVLRR